MKSARRTADIQPFVVMDVLARAHALEAAGRRVIHMGIGEAIRDHYRRSFGTRVPGARLRT